MAFRTYVFRGVRASRKEPLSQQRLGLERSGHRFFLADTGNAPVLALRVWPDTGWCSSLRSVTASLPAREEVPAGFAMLGRRYPSSVHTRSAVLS